MKSLLKRVAGALLGDYAPYQIYAIEAAPAAADPPRAGGGLVVREVDAAAIGASPDALVREQAGYAGEGARAYACLRDGRIVGVCFYWFGERYLKRNFWPLAEGEAKLVQIVVLPELRGQGIAAALVGGSARDMLGRGFGRAYARIWHSNTPSLRAFERAGWKRIAFMLEINPLRSKRPLRLRFGPGRPGRT